MPSVGAAPATATPVFPKQACKASCLEDLLRKLQPGRPSSEPPRAQQRRSQAAAGAAPHRSESCDSRRPRRPLHAGGRGRWTCQGGIATTAASEGAFGGICGGRLLAAIFRRALERGRLCLSVQELLDGLLAARAVSRPEAIGIVRTAWETGSLQRYCDMPAALQPDFLARGLERPEVQSAESVLRVLYVSPVCKRLTWPLLLTVLRRLNHECVRPSLDVILLVCRGVFGLECDEWDVIAAAASGPRGACAISSAPWPLQREEGMGEESLRLATTIISLGDALPDEANKVLPPYSPKLAYAVEAELLDSGLDIQWIDSWLEANLSLLTLPLILVLVSSQQTTGPCVPGGVLIWFWEEMLKTRSQKSETSSDRGSHTDMSGEGWVEEELTPLEAFISCFWEDLRTNQPLILSQLNNLYRMRSRGHDIRYRSHGYSRLGEFLAEVPGVVLVGSGNQMAVQVSDPVQLKEVAERVLQGLRKRAAELRARGVDTSRLELSYRRPQGVPRKILLRIWDLFQHAESSEIPVALFVSAYKERFPNDRLHFKSLGYQDVRGLMAYVPFVEKVGGRRYSKYVLKAGALPPEGFHGRQVRTGPHPPARSPHAGRGQWQPPWQFPLPAELPVGKGAGLPGKGVSPG